MSMFTPGARFTAGETVAGKGRTWTVTQDTMLPPDAHGRIAAIVKRLSKVRVRGKGGQWYAYHLGDTRGPVRVVGVGSTPEKAYQDWAFWVAYQFQTGLRK